MPQRSLPAAEAVPTPEWAHGRLQGRPMSRLRRLWLAAALLAIRLGRSSGSRRRPPYEEVSPGLLLGRCLTGRQAAWALGDGVAAVVDLAAEIPAPALLRALSYLKPPPGLGSQPSSAQLRLILAFIQRHRSRGKVLILCGGEEGRDVIAAHAKVRNRQRY